MKKLTPEELKDAQDALAAANDGKPWQYFVRGEWRETDCTVAYILYHDYLIRPKPEPKTRPWNFPEDVPGPVCWIRPKGHDWQRMIIMVNPLRITLVGGECRSLESKLFIEIKDYEYSTDRREWKPCVVTE